MPVSFQRTAQRPSSVSKVVVWSITSQNPQRAAGRFMPRRCDLGRGQVEDLGIQGGDQVGGSEVQR